MRAQEAQPRSGPLTDQRIIELVQTGVRLDEVVRVIATTPQVSFDLSPVATDNMLKAGVSEEIIKAMAARESGFTPNTVVQHSPALNKESIPGPQSYVAGTNLANADLIPKEVGIYIVLDGRLTPVQPDVYEIRDASVSQSVLTYGLKRAYFHGVVPGNRSPLRVSGPLQFIIKAPEGFSMADTRLLRLETKKDQRDFRTLNVGRGDFESGRD